MVAQVGRDRAYFSATDFDDFPAVGADATIVTSSGLE